MGDGGEFVGCPTIDGWVTASRAGKAKVAVANREFQERQRPVDPDLLRAIYTRGLATLANISEEPGADLLATSARLMVNCFLYSMAWGTMLRPENLLALRSKGAVRHREDQPGVCERPSGVALLLSV